MWPSKCQNISQCVSEPAEERMAEDSARLAMSNVEELTELVSLPMTKVESSNRGVYMVPLKERFVGWGGGKRTRTFGVCAEGLNLRTYQIFERRRGQQNERRQAQRKPQNRLAWSVCQCQRVLSNQLNTRLYNGSTYISNTHWLVACPVYEVPYFRIVGLAIISSILYS